MDPLIKGLFRKFRQDHALETMRESDAFELFIAALILRDDLLDQFDMTDLLLDQNTIGVDLALLEVNGEIVTSPAEIASVCDNKNAIDVLLTLVQVKSSAHVSSKEILNFGDIAQKVVSGKITNGNTKLSAISDALEGLYYSYASKLKNRPRVHLSYVTTANDASLEDANVRDRVNSVKEDLASLNHVGDISFDVYGATNLFDAHRVKTQSNEKDLLLEKSVNLPSMPGIDQGILGVISVRDLLNLIKNDDGTLNERVFYDNVRGYQGQNDVNQQIIETLRSDSRALLPVLNNGITVVARSYAPKPGDWVSVSDYQIVNGGQTSHCIYHAEDDLENVVDSVNVPIRLVITEDAEVAAQITRATNSQTAVDKSGLIALTNFQKRLEEYYNQDQLKVNLTYERRSGQFYGRDVTRTRIVTINEQIRSVAATFLDLPHVAARYPKHLYSDVGDSIFDDDHHLAPYVASAYAAYRLETAFRSSLEPEYKPIRFHILTAYKYRVLGKNAANLNSKHVEKQSKEIVESLQKSSDYVSTFRSAANKIIELAGGQLPSADRLKRQPFTQDLVQKIAHQ